MRAQGGHRPDRTRFDLAKARYDGRDDYDRHPRQATYRRADRINLTYAGSAFQRSGRSDIEVASCEGCSCV
jgi:hypothetical protein